MADVAVVRKRIRAEIDRARRAAAERRERTRTAERAYDAFLEQIAVPALRQIAGVLRSEGLSFEVQTPSGGVRLASDRHRDEGLTLELDTSQDPPVPILIATYTRGSRPLRSEAPVKPRTPIDQLTEDDLLEAVLQALQPWLA